MKLKIGSTFSFPKLLKYVKSEEFGDFISNTTMNPIIKASKEKIITGKVRPLLEKSTRERRRYKSSKSVNTPLYDTGALYKSLQLSDVRIKGGVLKGTKGIMMEKYGIYHINGFIGRGGSPVPKRAPGHRNFLVFNSSDKTSSLIIKKFRKIFSRLSR